MEASSKNFTTSFNMLSLIWARFACFMSSATSSYEMSEHRFDMARPQEQNTGRVES
jgi:hypothetical protein